VAAVTDDELAFAPAWRLSEMLDAKEVSSFELTQLFLRRIERLNPELNAYLTVSVDVAVDQARAADDAIARGERRSPLQGVPVSIKDLMETKGIRTTRGSLVYRDWVPIADAIAVEHLRDAGAVFLGKTNTPEFGHRGTTENRLGGPCRNPWNPERTAGGSSGGAAAALAAGLCPVATGSDGGGSVRIPASFCGVYGIKPTQGRVPSGYAGPGGWRPFSQGGPMARTVRDACLLFQVMAGPDPRDPTALKDPVPDFVAACQPDVRGLRIAWSPDLGSAPVDPEVACITADAARVFEGLGATVEPIDMPFDVQATLDAFLTVWHSDHVANFEAMAREHEEELDPVFRERLAKASRWPAGMLALALRDLEWHRGRMADALDGFDLLLTPTLATPAFLIGQPPEVIAGQRVSDPLWGFTPFTYPFNMSGNPAASVPCGFTGEGLPVGLQIVGRHSDEATVIRASAAFEEARPWSAWRAPIS
jgi:Asp-tRNA(Asn)/Glu-tRNA(Gln) amidotransferase A subunit family amidase